MEVCVLMGVYCVGGVREGVKEEGDGRKGG